MNAYLPTHAIDVWFLAFLLPGVLFSAFAITRLRSVAIARPAAWLLVVASSLAAERLTSGQPAGWRMLAIILTTLFAMKGVVSVEERAAGKRPLRPLSWFLFAAGWLGMRPSEFAAAPGKPRDGGGELIRRGAMRLAAGLALVALARLAWRSDVVLDPSVRFALVAALLLMGVSFVLHFGLLNILAGLWRKAGAHCRALFRAPACATSLTEFWGRRWNLAFCEMTAVAVFRPLRRLAGPRMATLAAFVFSGLLHELATSVPVKAGFGLPLLYFTLHGVAVLAEQTLACAGYAIDRLPWLGRAWTTLWLLLPLPLLFHAPFLRACLWPIVS